MLVLALILAFLTVIVVRALLFRPLPQKPVADVPVTVNAEKVVSDMRDMVRCKTVSGQYPEDFEAFRALLRERFPLIHKACTLHHLGETGLLYHLAGHSHDCPAVCMAHYDVVPVEENGWSKPAFEGILEDGVIWGRGTLDTKGTLCGVMEALEALLKEGYVPKNDLYLSFSGDEEVDGHSCPAIVSWLEEHGIVPELVLDEGGAVVDHVFPGVPNQCAMIGIAEKGGFNVDFTMDSQGGHASTPPPKQLLGHLSRALLKIEKTPFPFQLTKPAKEMFNTVGRHSTFLYRLIFANLWCFAPVVNLIARMSGGEFNAMMRTTVAITKFEGSQAYNVMPPKARFGVNIRLLGHDTMDSALEYLKKIIKNDKITATPVGGMNPSPCSDINCEGWEIVKTAIRQTWPEAIVSPYLMMACSDSRHYNRISDKVYRFSAMYLSKEERKMIHGNDERIPVETLLTTVKFYTRLLNQL